MTYFADLTPYEYFAFHPIGWPPSGPLGTCGEDLFARSADPQFVYSDPEVNVGWLDAAHPFATAQPDPRFVGLLAMMCDSREHRVHQTRGYPPCPFCDLWTSVASAEIRVQGDGVVYAAPTLIAHYVGAHHYTPPRGFVEAVLRSEGASATTGGAPRPVPDELLRREPIDWRTVDAHVRTYVRGDLVLRELEIEPVPDGMRVWARVDCSITPFAIDGVIPDWACLRTDQVAYGIWTMIFAREQDLGTYRFHSQLMLRRR
ncbi:Hypothetical protein I5071_48940 [Sandaracinus amylolyticus]|nr:Hypothetical protein I5071_48940 [Sandaracinus amylolyticus]